MSGRSSILRVVLRIALVGGCLFYVAYGLEFDGMLSILASFDATAAVLLSLVMLAHYACLAGRLRYIAEDRPHAWTSFNAGLLALGVNSIAPGKLGELGKAFYLRRFAGMTNAQSLSAVFWERFFDLNAMLALGLVVAASYGNFGFVAPLALVAAAFWLGLWLLRTRSELFDFAVEMFHFEKLKQLLRDIVDQLNKASGSAFWLVVSGWTIPVWASYALMYYVLLPVGMGLELGFFQVLSVFAAAVVGYSLPSSPAALGVFEAAMVGALNLYDVEKEQALAAAMLFRAFHTLPVTIYSLVLIGAKGLSLTSIQREERKPDETAAEHDKKSETI